MQNCLLEPGKLGRNVVLPTLQLCTSSFLGKGVKIFLLC